jgi:hypothetical protein
MPHDGGDTYERVLALIGDLEAPATDEERRITWCTAEGPVGVARSPEGRIEIFLVGEELKPHLPEVQDNLQFQQWHRTGSTEPVWASRLLLPRAPHFEKVAAFLCTELLRVGAAIDLAGAFAATEPVIALALQRLRLADDDMLGLCGELVLLHSLIGAAPDAWVAQMARSWHGFGRSSRDFQFGAVGVEVKTTTQTASSHHIESVHQVEPGHGVGGAPESTLVLISVGLQWRTQGAGLGITLPALVDAVLERVRDASGDETAARAFLDGVRAYGAAGSPGYHHARDAHNPSYAHPFGVTFVRGYDMGDPAVQVLRSDDIRQRPSTELHSVRFRVNLPHRVRGDINPVHGLASCRDDLIARLSATGFANAPIQ